MTKCNSRPTGDRPAYISPSINTGPLENEVPRIRLNDVTDQELLQLIVKIEEAFKSKNTFSFNNFFLFYLQIFVFIQHALI